MLKSLAKLSFILGVALLGNPIISLAHGDEHHANTQSEETAKIPDNDEAIWKKIDEEVMLLNKAIADNTLDKVHHHAFAIKDLVVALPEHSPSLSEAQQAKLKSNLEYVSTLAQRLDENGDKNDKAATQANMDKLQKILDNLRANYSDLKSNKP